MLKSDLVGLKFGWLLNTNIKCHKMQTNTYVCKFTYVNLFRFSSLFRQIGVKLKNRRNRATPDGTSSYSYTKASAQQTAARCAEYYVGIYFILMQTLFIFMQTILINLILNFIPLKNTERLQHKRIKQF